MENNNKINLVREVYSKTGYPKIIDTKFNQLGNISVNEQLNASITVDQFFETYTQLFYDIPSYGNINSHEYLITTSTEYIGFEADNAIINALQSEITQLRRDLLQSQIDMAETLSGNNLGIDLNSLEDENLQGNAFKEIQSRIQQSTIVN
jgi:hypothetical protein